MEYKFVFILVAAFLFQASFSMADDALVTFTKQIAVDIILYKDAQELKVSVLKELDELKKNADQLLQKRQANQNDPDLQSKVQAGAEKVIVLAKDYIPAETKSLETAKSHVHMVVDLVEDMKKRP